MRISMLTRIAVLIARPAPLTHLLEAGVLLHQLLHQAPGLVAVKARDLPDFLVAQARLVAACALHQNTEHAGFGGLPVDAAAGLALTVFGQAVIEVRVNAPVGPPASAAMLDVAGGLHGREPLANFRL